jgi:serine/threonine protein phosphatase 1
MAARTIAIGDIHGCADALRAVVDAIDPQQDDTLIPLGDVIDRGSDSRGAIEQLLALQERCQLVPILGNHEEMMLNFFDEKPQPDDWIECGGGTTLRSYGPRENNLEIDPAHTDFIRTWGDCYETDMHFFVHASYEPRRPLTEQHWQSLRWHSLRMGIPEPHCSGKTAVVGHTSLKDGEIWNLGHIICIDTFSWGGGWLTAFEPATGQTWQADREGRLRQT